MKRKLTGREAKAVVEIHKLLKDCIIFDNIEDKVLICKNLYLLKNYKSEISEEMYSAVEAFINETIKPIIYDKNYFDFLFREEFGEYNEEGPFVINSEHSLDMMICLLYERTIELGKKLDDFSSKHMHLNIKQ